MSDDGVVTSRNIGGIIANVTVSEEHQDELEITSHPVELGAQVTDHAFAQPSIVTIRAGWSNSSTASSGDQYVRDIYAQLLALQKGRKPLSIVTGKRNYENMLIKSLSLTTDQATEDALFVTASCREILLVSTSTTTVPSNDVQSDPASTGGVQSRGSIQPTPASPNTGPNSGALGETMAV